MPDRYIIWSTGKPPSFDVLDRLFNYRQLASFPCEEHGLKHPTRLHRATALCARLNAEHEAWVRDA